MNTNFNSKAITIFEEDERFKAVERAKDRENLFEDYLVELGNKVGFRTPTMVDSYTI